MTTHNAALTYDKILEDAQLTGVLVIIGRRLKRLPDVASNYDLSDIVEANFSRNRLNELPAQLTGCESLERLQLSENLIRSLPISIQHLRSLQFLDLSYNQLQYFPRELFLLPLEILILRRNRLVELPSDICNLASSLLELDVSDNRLERLPKEITSLKKLKVLNCKGNSLKEIPSDISLLPLRVLDISFNEITSLVPDLRRIISLRHLYIDGNPLVYPPAKICKNGRCHIFKALESQGMSGVANSRWLLPEVEDQNRVTEHHIERRKTRQNVGTVDSGYSTTSEDSKRNSGKVMAAITNNQIDLNGRSVFTATHKFTTNDEKIRPTHPSVTQHDDDVEDGVIIIDKTNDYRLGLSSEQHQHSVSDSNEVKKSVAVSTIVSNCHQVPSPKFFETSTIARNSPHFFRSVDNQASCSNSICKIPTPTTATINSTLLSSGHIKSCVAKVIPDQSAQIAKAKKTIRCNPGVQSATCDVIKSIYTSNKASSNTNSNLTPSSLLKTPDDQSIDNCVGDVGKCAGVDSSINMAALTISIAKTDVDNLTNKAAIYKDSEHQDWHSNVNYASASSSTSSASPSINTGNSYSKPATDRISGTVSTVKVSASKFAHPQQHSKLNGSDLSSSIAVNQNTCKRPVGIFSNSIEVSNKKSSDITRKPSPPLRTVVQPSQLDRQRKMIDEMRNILSQALNVELPGQIHELADLLSDGIHLCNYLNFVQPKAIRIVHHPTTTVPRITMARRNVENFLIACRRLGITEAADSPLDSHENLVDRAIARSSEFIVSSACLVIAVHKSSNILANLQPKLCEKFFAALGVGFFISLTIAVMFFHL